METVRQDFVQTCAFLGANILSLQLVLSFPKLFVHGSDIKDERPGWGGRAVGSTREQSKLNASEAKAAGASLPRPKGSVSEK